MRLVLGGKDRARSGGPKKKPRGKEGRRAFIRGSSLKDTTGGREV